MNLTVGGFFWHYRSAAGRPLHKNILQYLNYIIADLGDPPQLERARTVGRKASLQIYFESADTSWSTAENVSDVHKAHWRNWSEKPLIRLGRYHGHHFVELPHASGRFVFGMDKNIELDPERRRMVVILLTLLTLILSGAFFAIRWILRPVRWLQEGVQEVGRGNLKHRVPVKRSDELRELAAAFNDMTDRIRVMLHTKEQLMLDVSHELRSPLTRMKVALEFLAEGQAKDSLKSDIAEMEAMINEILETARMHHLHSNLKRRLTNLAELLKSVLADYKSQPPGIEAGEFPGEIELNVDPEQVKTVLQNILTNAIKFSNPEDKPVMISIVRQSDAVVIRVLDHGIGIPPDELSFIFEPFYRVDKSRSKRTGGYGLGLSLCKTIMEAHGGRIEVDSKPGQGTCVSLFFPQKG
ncbi:MAG: HAMP domain-containing sensor histidine kinase [Desulfobacterales bacterium]